MTVLLRLKGVGLKDKIYKKVRLSYVLVDSIITGIITVITGSFKKVTKKVTA